MVPAAVALGPAVGARGLAALGPRNITANAVLPGVASETAGQMTQGTSWEPYARVGGIIGNMALGP